PPPRATSTRRGRRWREATIGAARRRMRAGRRRQRPAPRARSPREPREPPTESAAPGCRAPAQPPRLEEHRSHRRAACSCVGLALLRLPMAIGRRHVAGRYHAQGIDAAAIGSHDPELESVDGRGLPAPRQPAELLHEQPRHGLEAFLLREMGAKVLVELLDPRHATNEEEALRLLADVLIVLDIELIVDVADDLFDDILDRDQTRYAAVLIYHDGHVIAAAAKFLEQHVEALGFRH